ncbi:MAG: dihydropteroate synthase-like protein [Methanobrevibacter sp.]|nr:dihydropteroate synthase-like protein [Methanobrevibacter sp.]
MKILIITGHLAYPLISKIAKSANDNVKSPNKQVIVHKADTQVAAFLTPNKVIEELTKNYEGDLNEIEMILVPGLMKKNSSEITKAIKIPCFKGSTDGADLGMVLELVGKIELSETKTADSLIEEEKRKQAFKFIEDFETNTEKVNSLLQKPNNILIKNLPVGEDFPMRVLCEIANAPLLTKEELIFKAKYFLNNGADMIDIGMVAGEDYSKEIPNLIKTLREIIGDKPLSIDTLNPKEIEMAIEHDIDLVLSLDLGNYEDLLPKLKEKNIPAVLLPTNFKANEVPHTIEDRLNNIEKLIEKCNGLKIFADLILDPINSLSIVDSIVAVKKFKDKHPHPVFFGVGNVTELLDVDSQGVNALISGIGSELKASVLFTPDESGKTWNSVYELVISSKMMFLAKHRGSVPKDLGLNLINFKDKKKLSFDNIIASVNSNKENNDNNINNNVNNIDNNLNVIIAEKEPKFVHDPCGSFKINVIHGTRYDKSKIEVTHFIKGVPDIIIEGTKAKEIFNEIIERKLISRLEHTAYLGAELQKAEIAMISSKEYVQDFELFKKPLILDNDKYC